MKKIKSSLAFLLCSAAILLCSNISLAQRTSGYGQTVTYLKIGENSINIENTSFTDALGANNNMTHTASFDIALNDLDDTKAILNALQSFTKDKKNLQLFFIKLDANLKAQENKLYNNTTVEEISIAALNAASKDALKVSVKIKAATVELQTGESKGLASIGGKDRSRSIVSSYFRFTMGALPAVRVSAISSLVIRSQVNQPQSFTIVIPVTDGAQWNQWFQTGAGGIKKEQGSIELLAPDFKKVLLTIQLADVDIISYATASTTGDRIAKATVGLRSKNIAFKF